MLQPTTDTQEFLQDIETELELQPASPGARFVNHLLDLILFYVIFLAIGVIYGIVNYREIAASGAAPENLTGSSFGDFLLAFVVYILMYTLQEGLSGRTLGKLFTGTHVLKLDGSKVTMKDAFVRSLIRFIPFEPFTAFSGYPWHDTWTNTMVVKKQK